MRCVPCVAFLLALACATFAASAYAGPGPLSSISSDALLASFGGVMFAMVAGYELRQDRDLRDHKGETQSKFDATDRKITDVNHELAQLQSAFNLMYADFHKGHPSRPEFDTLRSDMHRGFDELKDLLRERR